MAQRSAHRTRCHTQSLTRLHAPPPPPPHTHAPRPQLRWVGGCRCVALRLLLLLLSLLRPFLQLCLPSPLTCCLAHPPPRTGGCHSTWHAGSFWISVGVYGVIRTAGIFFLDSPKGQQALTALSGVAGIGFMVTDCGGAGLACAALCGARAMPGPAQHPALACPNRPPASCPPPAGRLYRHQPRPSPGVPHDFDHVLPAGKLPRRQRWRRNSYGIAFQATCWLVAWFHTLAVCFPPPCCSLRGLRARMLAR